ncbi:MAG: DUF4843 domain-containing protein [Bacteroidaceae bacterium]|nr:DUF4843 domain-containing protein [Bacteroidaceae bacterium]MCF0195277.1 DUF4843 domain-containing protein [Bacteroidaceae bacterium]
MKKILSRILSLPPVGGSRRGAFPHFGGSRRGAFPQLGGVGGGLLLALLLFSCDNEKYMTYDATNDGVYFTRDTLEYAFGVTPVDVRTHDYKFQLQLLGTVADHDREFFYEVTDTTTAVEGRQFRLGKGVIPAGSTRGTITVTLLRDGLGGQYPDYEVYRLGVRVKKGGGFSPVLADKDQWRVLTFSNAVEQPEWRSPSGVKIWSTTKFGVWHPLKFIKMVEYFHTIATHQPRTYEKMVVEYGENLEHVPYGDFHSYQTIMNKYVFGPMYEYFSDPANHDAIVALYPDFPFDFPNPY